jgi:Cys-tRNA(Pro)/Cys-tRNA(Cys) deacylase
MIPVEYKTNVMRRLDSLKIEYRAHSLADKEAISGVEVAAALGEDPARMFKTLVTTGRSGRNYVFLIPVAAELDLRKAAACVGEKSVEMIRLKDLLPLTGYVHGGCSPIGMKKPFRTVVHRSAAEFDAIIFSAGKIGYQVELSTDALRKAVPFELADLVI